MTSPDAVAHLLDRSNRLGADPRNTNYAGGNTSAKGTALDPVTGAPTELLWVKGSGGDLGTLTEAGLAVLRLDRLRALAGQYPGEEREDEMVAAFDFCLHGRGGAAPSIDTAMHGLLDAAHVDHLHPDSGIALATAADGPELTRQCFGDRVVWVPWRRPGFQLGLDIAAIAREHPQAIGAILGGHGVTAWGATSEECEAHSLEIIRTAEDVPRPRTAGPSRSAPPSRRSNRCRTRSAAPARPRSPRCCAAWPPPTARRSATSATTTWCSTSCPARTTRPWPRSAPPARTTSCAPRSGRMVLDLPPTRPLDEVVARLRELHAEYREQYAAYYQRHATPDSPPMRGAGPGHRARPRRRHVQLRSQQADRAGGRRVLRQRHQRDARRAVGLAVRTDPGVGEVPHRVLGAGGGEAAHACRNPSRWRRGSRSSPAAAPASAGRSPSRLAAEGACVVVADRDARRRREGRGRTRRRPTSRYRSPSTSPTRRRWSPRIAATVLAFGGVDLVVNNAGLSISKALLETSAQDWDVQHDVMARGSFLVAREAARAMVAQGIGGDIVYIASKNSVFAGPNNVAYGAAKADQAHQVRLLAAELGEHGIRVNGVNPDGVVRGSGIFAGGWGAQRAAVYGVQEEELGAFYAQRTLLKREVLPEHVANAVFALTGGDLSHTTGLHVPVDAGVAAAFLR